MVAERAARQREGSTTLAGAARECRYASSELAGRRVTGGRGAPYEGHRYGGSVGSQQPTRCHSHRNCAWHGVDLACDVSQARVRMTLRLAIAVPAVLRVSVLREGTRRSSPSSVTCTLARGTGSQYVTACRLGDTWTGPTIAESVATWGAGGERVGRFRRARVGAHRYGDRRLQRVCFSHAPRQDDFAHRSRGRVTAAGMLRLSRSVSDAVDDRDRRRRVRARGHQHGKTRRDVHA